jgi:hypothetical protein
VQVLFSSLRSQGKFLPSLFITVEKQSRLDAIVELARMDECRVL